MNFKMNRVASYIILGLTAFLLPARGPLTMQGLGGEHPLAGAGGNGTTDGAGTVAV